MNTFTTIIFLSCLFAPALGLVPGLWFDRVFIVVLENQAYENAVLNGNLSSLATYGRLLTNYSAVIHPSQPNYLAMTSGATWTTNDANINVSASNIVDLLEAKGVSWKTYQEGYPGSCVADQQINNYYRKHNPFMSYDDVRMNATRCALIVNASSFDDDIASNSLAQYIFYTPDINNDGHNTGLAFGGAWVTNFLLSRINNTNFVTNRTLVIVTFDEDDNTHNNHIYTLLLGGGVVTAGSQDPRAFNHYSLLRTIEDNWSLGNLGRGDASAERTFFVADPTTTTSSSTTTSGPSDSSSASLIAHCTLCAFAGLL